MCILTCTYTCVYITCTYTCTHVLCTCTHVYICTNVLHVTYMYSVHAIHLGIYTFIV